MKYINGALVLSSHNNEVQPTRNNRFSLRCRVETGTSEAYRAAKLLNVELSDEQRQEHSQFQTLFLFSENEAELQALRENLLTGGNIGKKSVLVRGQVNEFVGRAFVRDEETGEGEERTSRNLSCYTNRLQAYNRAARTWVPLSAAYLS